VEISHRQNKYLKYSFLSESRRLSKYLPSTATLKKRTLTAFLNKYGDIILKPIDGKRGFGVIRITEKNRKQYKIHTEDIRLTLEGSKHLYNQVKKFTGSRGYLVQRRISLATVTGRPFDIRVIVQRKSETAPWKVTGKAVKVAGKGFIVTNIERSRGTVMTLKTAIRKSLLKNSSPTRLESKIEKVALRAASRLSKLYRNQYIFGFDMALDKNGRVWIIEANLSPMLSHFKKLGSRKMYRRIIRYKEGARRSRADFEHKTQQL
jgi:glutathione synthase/RimK-type ligase-like ATP-grasp enzyme